MPFVLVVGARDVDRAGALLRAAAPGGRVEPAADDAVQGVFADADAGAVVDVVLELVREPGRHVGVGAGPADGARPGTALLAARRAAEAARRRPSRLAVRGPAPADAGDAQAVLTALAVLRRRRTAQAWEAVTLVGGGRTQVEAAAALGISRQAVGQRLAAGLWDLECELRPTAVRLLTRAAG